MDKRRFYFYHELWGLVIIWGYVSTAWIMKDVHDPLSSFSVFETLKRMQTHFQHWGKKNNYNMCFFGDSNCKSFAEPRLDLAMSASGR